MRFLSVLLLVCLATTSAMADNFFQSNNPFGSKVYPESLYNIYETTPSAIEQDKETVQKVKKSHWWQVKKDTKNIPQHQEPQRAEDSGFILFK